MFSKFNLKEISESNGIFEDYYVKGKELYDANGQRIVEKLKKFIRIDGTIDGSSLQDSWFPHDDNKFNVFLSHSHADEKLAIQISGWLKEKFDINTFIDSCLWGYADVLLKEIDEKYCKTLNTQNYDYKKRNYSTSHVHMMLSIALSKVIDKTECIIFLNTPKSVSLVDELEVATVSPWIYHELAMTTMIRQTPLEQYRKSTKYREGRDGEILFEALENEMTITYKVNEYVNNLINLNIGDLETWDENFKDSGRNALTELYVLKKVLEKKPKKYFD